MRERICRAPLFAAHQETVSWRSRVAAWRAEHLARMVAGQQDRPGAWSHEPNEFEWEHAGFLCRMWRNRHGAWCGYVGVPVGHPWHGLKMDDIDASVHGGVTWSDDSFPGSDRIGLWAVGFDCIHWQDAAPLDDYLASEGAVYRDADYVRRETESLAEQAAEAGHA